MVKQIVSTITLLLVTGMAGGLAVGQKEEQQASLPIRNFLRVNDQFYTGGQPRVEQLAKLKADGVKTIINLRPPGEHRAAEEEAVAKELRVRYYQLQEGRRPSPHQAAKPRRNRARK